MHENFVVGFDCPVCPPPRLRTWFNLHAH